MTSQLNLHEHKSTDAGVLNAFKRQDWIEAESAVANGEICNRTIEYIDDNKWNAIHWACYNGAPENLLGFLLLVAEEKQIMARDNDGFTPLHHALRNSNDDVTRMILHACHRAAFVVTDHGETPLHVSICCNRSPVIIMNLLEINPAASIQKNKLGDTPIEEFFRLWNIGLREAIKSLSSVETDILDMNVTEDSCGEDTVAVRWIYKITLYLLEAATCGSLHGELNKNTFQPIHASLHLDNCPWSFFRLLLQVYSHGALEKDRYCTDLLKIAANAKSSSDGQLYECWNCDLPLIKFAWLQHKQKTYYKYCRRCFSTMKKSELECNGQNFLCVSPVDKMSFALEDLKNQSPKVKRLITNLEGRVPNKERDNEAGVGNRSNKLDYSGPRALTLMCSVAPTDNVAIMQKCKDSLQIFRGASTFLSKEVSKSMYKEKLQ